MNSLLLTVFCEWVWTKFTEAEPNNHRVSDRINVRVSGFSTSLDLSRQTVEDHEHLGHKALMVFSSLAVCTMYTAVQSCYKCQHESGCVVLCHGS